ncbi:unnamed protein product [Albugo candida]|uniref:Uncharacterized protein n=1 Tax=Albugo candida TaxID=65357 RepID=A0A024FTR6_9STRA|nr:unnamed protein product [Albugo candida]|eukprot:CCI10523.1 unnamed protein product [Albugo candida]
MCKKVSSRAQILPNRSEELISVMTNHRKRTNEPFRHYSFQSFQISAPRKLSLVLAKSHKIPSNRSNRFRCYSQCKLSVWNAANNRKRTQNRFCQNTFSAF